MICQLSHKDNFRGKLFAGFCEGSHMDIEGNAVIDASCWARKDISRYGFVSSQRHAPQDFLITTDYRKAFYALIPPSI